MEKLCFSCEVVLCAFFARNLDYFTTQNLLPINSETDSHPVSEIASKSVKNFETQ